MLVALWSNRGGLVHGVCGRRQGVSVFVAAAAFALAACSGGSAAPGSATTSSSTTATVPGPSTSLTAEQQAAEEAKAALLSYEQTVDSINQAGGQDPNKRLAKVALGKQLAFLMRDAQRLRDNRWRQVGSTEVKNLEVRSVRLSDTSRAVLNLCLDASKTDAVDSSGKSIRKPGSFAFFQQMVTLTKREDSWLVSEEDDKPVKSC
jgi:hypothetical protein